MKICRFKTSDQHIRVGMFADESILDLSCQAESIEELLESEQTLDDLRRIVSSGQGLPRYAFGEVTLLSPVERQEVWAAGVTYLRSKKARMEESEFSASAYDRVYEAARPELFFKSVPEKVVGPGVSVGIRRDAKWNVPEPELALVINSRGRIAGCTIGNDMSSRDIEGENLLYLPQAKIYTGSCALGPCIHVGSDENEARSWGIRLEIERAGTSLFRGETSVSQIKRSFSELTAFLFRSQSFPHGAILLTGTGIVPPDGFTLEPNDRVRITISGIGVLENPVVSV